MTVKDIVKKYRKLVKRCVRGTNLLASVVMAQIIYESASDDGKIGESILAMEYNNDVRLRADKSWKGKKVLLDVRPFTRHKEFVRKTWFRAYTDSEQAVEDRINMLIKAMQKWPTSLFHHDTVESQASIMQLAEGSGDQHYAERIIGIIKRHKLYKEDLHWWIQSIITNIVIYVPLTYAIQRWDDWVPWRQ